MIRCLFAAVLFLALAGLPLPSRAAAARPRSVSGRIVDARGRPVAGAAVRFVIDPKGGFSWGFLFQKLKFEPTPRPTAAEAKTDRHGRFPATFLPGSGLLVVVRRGGRTVGVTYLPAKRQGKVRLALRWPKVIHGRVIHKDGRPVAGALVTVRSTFFALPPVRTGKRGRFWTRVPLDTVPYLAEVTGPGLARSRQALKLGTDNRVTARPGREVTGTVRYQGKPVAGARVHTVTVVPVDTETDAAGHFAITGLPQIRTFTDATIDVRKGDAFAKVPLPGSIHPPPVAIILEPPARIRVQVVDAGHRPVAGATVSANGETRMTGVDGVATIASAPRMPLEVRVDAEGHGRWQRQVTVAGDPTRVVAHLVDGGAIRVQVSGVVGPSRGVVVTADPDTADDAFHQRQAPLDAHDLARIPYLADGRYVVRVEGLSQAAPPPIRVTVPHPKPVRIVLPPSLAIAGRVVDGHGHPVAKAFVEARRAGVFANAKAHPNEATYGTTTGAHGRFEIAPVGPGPYTVTAGGARPWPRSEPVATKAGVTHLSITLHRGRHVTGVLVDLAGHPVTGGHVQLVPLVGGRPDKRPFSQRDTGTDARGRFDLGFLRPGPVRLRAWKGLSPRVSSKVLVVPAGTRDLTVVVGPPR